MVSLRVDPQALAWRAQAHQNRRCPAARPRTAMTWSSR